MADSDDMSGASPMIQHDPRARMPQAEMLPLWWPEDPQRAIAFRHGRPVPLAEFASHVSRIVQRLPPGDAMINLCEDRYCFIAAYAAALSAGHTVLLPPTRAEQVVAEVQGGRNGSYRCDDSSVEAAIASELPPLPVTDRVAADHIVMIGFTSGSTGVPKQFPKAWHSVSSSTAKNVATIRDLIGSFASVTPAIVATVPPQHMYGMELSVLMPLIGGMAVHSGRPLFPADIARSLGEIPEPRILVSTPVHLRAIAESTQAFPPLALAICATAPLDAALAQAVEAKLGGPLLELFGSTETCVLAHRRTAVEELWQLYDGVELQPGQSSTLVNAPWFVAPVMLQDVLELQAPGRFRVRGRNTDMIEVAGKRASLSDLTRRLLAIDGVRDAVVFQPDEEEVAAVRRVAALVVAPGLTARQITEQLTAGVDPAFLPRPLVLVDTLPRNELGKIPRQELLRALRRK